MKYPPIAGAWSVEAMIATLLLLLFTRAFGIAITLWTTAISLIVGVAIVSAIHALSKSRDTRNS
jgi:hypothetical protein